MKRTTTFSVTANACRTAASRLERLARALHSKGTDQDPEVHTALGEVTDSFERLISTLETLLGSRRSDRKEAPLTFFDKEMKAGAIPSEFITDDRKVGVFLDHKGRWTARLKIDHDACYAIDVSDSDKQQALHRLEDLCIRLSLLLREQIPGPHNRSDS
jgi:hypothetical protein